MGSKDAIFSPGLHRITDVKNCANAVEGMRVAAANRSHHRSCSSPCDMWICAAGFKQTEFVRVSKWPTSWNKVKMRAASFQCVLAATTGANSSHKEKPFDASEPN